MPLGRGLTRADHERSGLEPLHEIKLSRQSDSSSREKTRSRTNTPSRKVETEEEIYAAPAASSGEDSDAQSVAEPDGDDSSDLLPPTKRRRLSEAPSSSQTQAQVDSEEEEEEAPFGGISSQGTHSSQGRMTKQYGKGAAQKRTARNPAAAKKAQSSSKTSKAQKEAKERPTPSPNSGFKPPKHVDLLPGSKSGFKSPLKFVPDLTPRVNQTVLRKGRPLRSAAAAKGRSGSGPAMIKSAAVTSIIEATGLQDNELVKQAKAESKRRTNPLVNTPPGTSASDFSPTSTQLTSPPTVADSFDDTSFDESSTHKPANPQCFVCAKEISDEIFNELLDVFHPRSSSDKKFGISRPTARLNARQQMRFCQLHREHTAREEWKKRKYPEIDWPKLPERVEVMRSALTDLIDSGAEESLFMQRIREANSREQEDDASSPVKSRKRNRGRRQKVASEVSSSFGSEDVGYFGGRGARVFGETLVQMFATKFRDAEGETQRGIADAGGVTAFVQRVLVPEVCLRLAQEDFGLGREKALKLLSDSAELGRLLCEEENDEVEDDEVSEDDL